MAQRTTVRFDDDVHRFLRKMKKTYPSQNMTTVLHLCLRHCRDEGLLEEILKDPDPPQDERDNSSVEKMGEDEDVSTEESNSPSSPDRKNTSESGVSFDDLEPEEKEKGDEELHVGNGSDENNSHENGPSCQDEEKQESTAGAFFDRIKE